MEKRESSLENLEIKDNSFWSGKKILITGHTGFKGSWLCEYLLSLGAEIFGYALKPNTNQDLFCVLNLENRVNSQLNDIRNADLLEKYINQIQPDFIFHLAAQSLVRTSYNDPLGTWNTNVMGTANLLAGAFKLQKKCSIIIVTTDKVYENSEWVYAYRETDRLGGHDPYSASKASAEILTSSWRNSFNTENIKVASVRAGNVIGGGDWAVDRIVPDIVRSSISNQPLIIRNPNSIRPWQHVLDPLNGYLRLAKYMHNEASNDYWQSSFNFGPLSSGQQSVKDLVNIASQFSSFQVKFDKADTLKPESNILKLSIEKVMDGPLKWHPKWEFETAVAETMKWYESFKDNIDMIKFTQNQIMDFLKT